MIPTRLLLLLTLLITTKTFAQGNFKPHRSANTVKQSKLVGTWRLLEFEDRETDTSEWIYSYGKHPKGYFTYTSNGIVNINISAEHPLKISEDSARHYTVNLEHWLNYNALGYFGTYTVDLSKSIVTHHVKGGSMTWYTDTDQPRPFMFKGDTLIIGDTKVWKRVLVRAD